MGRILKYLFYLAVLGAIALVAYAYFGPELRDDFTPEQREIRQRILLDAN